MQHFLSSSSVIDDVRRRFLPKFMPKRFLRSDLFWYVCRNLWEMSVEREDQTQNLNT